MQKLVTVKEIFTTWNEGRLATGVITGSTAIRDLRTYEKYIGTTKFNQLPASRITREEWTSFLQENLPGKTAKEFGRLKGVVRGILQYAEDHHLIDYCDDDVINKVRAPKNSFVKKKKDPQNDVYFSDELAALRQYCVDHPDPYTRCILLETLIGERPGELCSIMVKDVDLANMQIAIRRTETRDHITGRQKDVVREGAKTEAGIREVPISGFLEPVLRKALADRKKNPEGLLFYDYNKNGIIETSQVNSTFKRICDKAGIEHTGQHMLRHTFATRCIEAGVSPLVLKNWLGHTNIHITLDTYSDVFARMNA